MLHRIQYAIKQACDALKCTSEAMFAVTEICTVRSLNEMLLKEFVLLAGPDKRYQPLFHRELSSSQLIASRSEALVGVSASLLEAISCELESSRLNSGS